MFWREVAVALSYLRPRDGPAARTGAVGTAIRNIGAPVATVLQTQRSELSSVSSPRESAASGRENRDAPVDETLVVMVVAIHGVMDTVALRLLGTRYSEKEYMAII
jgi:hypothetical protein